MDTKFMWTFEQRANLIDDIHFLNILKDKIIIFRLKAICSASLIDILYIP